MPSARRTDLGLLVLRLALAFAVFSYGLSKALTWDRSIEFFRAMSFPLPSITAPLNLGLELAAGLMLASGVGVRAAALIVILDFVFIVPANLYLENLNLEFVQFTVARIAPAIALILLGSGTLTVGRSR